MSSFEVDYDDVVQKIRESEGAKNAKYDHISPLLNVFFFVKHHHNVPQKDRSLYRINI